MELFLARIQKVSDVYGSTGSRRPLYYSCSMLRRKAGHSSADLTSAVHLTHASALALDIQVSLAKIRLGKQ